MYKNQVMQLVLDTNGLIVKKRNDCFYIVKGKQHRLIHPKRIDSIAVTADCLLSATAIRLAVANQIPIFFVNQRGRIEGRLWSAYFGTISELRRSQVLFAETSDATKWILDLFQLKSLRQFEHLQVIGMESKEIREALSALENAAEQFTGIAGNIREVSTVIMGNEGALAVKYWRAISSALPPAWQFGQRTRRPAQDPFNAALNYGYGMLYGVVENALFGAGLDPYLGLLHADEYNKPTLVFDVIEPFRPWVDALITGLFIQEAFQEGYFEEKGDGYWLSKSGRGFFIPLFNDFKEELIPVDGLEMSRQNHIYKFAAEFADLLRKQQF